MQTVELIQGSPQWHEHRAKYFNASDAPAMMGVSKYKTRTELLRERKTGISAGVDAATQRRFDDGHRFEAHARKLAEDIIGEELYPVTGVNGELSASLDGATMMEDLIFEHKTLNDEIRGAETAEELHPMYLIQVEHQFAVSGADKCLFMASKWDGDGNLVEEKHFWINPDFELRKRIIAGWKQFAADLEAFEPEPEVIQAKAEPVMALPALSIQVGGSISIQSNLDRFGVQLKSFIEETNAKPESDQDFANLEQACKVLKDAEDALKQAESSALAQTSSVDEMRRTVSYLANLARTNRLLFEKIVKSEKESRKTAIVSKGREELESHLRQLQAGLPMKFMVSLPNFADAIKGKKTLASMQDAVGTMLANAKIDANALAEDLRGKHAWYIENAGQYSFLFHDLNDIIYKAADDFQAVANSRIAQHKEQERIKAEEQAKAQAEREERIRREAEEKAQREAAQREEQIKRDAEAKARAEERARISAEQAEQQDRERLISQAVQEVDQHQKQLKESGFREPIKGAPEVGPSPGRKALIMAVASKYFVTPYEAEQWLINEFGTCQSDIDRLAKLTALESCGVDNWDGYDEAMDMIEDAA